MVPRKYGSGRGVGEACGPGVLPEPRPRLTVTEIRFKADASLHAVLRDMTHPSVSASSRKSRYPYSGSLP